LFMSSGGALYVFGVDGVKEVLTKAKVRNIQFDRLDEFEYIR